MAIASYIEDITWDMMGDAGIDASRVSKKPTADGGDEYVLEDGDVKVAFGPSVTEQGNPAIGWEVSAYESESDASGSYWKHIRQEHAATASEALRLVAAAVAFG